MPCRLGVTWMGHATVLLELDGARVITDPVLHNRIGPLNRVTAPVGAAAVERVDAVLLSHLHADHAEVASLRRLGRTAPVIAPLGAGRWLAGRGVGGVREVRPGEEVNVGPLRVRATPATHDGRRHPLAPLASAIGFVGRGSRSFYFAGDTDLFPAMRELAGTIDLALLPIWGWGRTLGPGHLDPDRAALAAALIAPRVAIPIHWGTFAPPIRSLGAKDPARRAREFAALVARRAPGVEARVLPAGASTEIA
jgi:L-ascorbate metabolism protein UlaG (beta-lactamase superfamily)